MADGVTADVRLLAGRYQIGELLGRGGMADVHAGIDARLGRQRRDQAPEAVPRQRPGVPHPVPPGGAGRRAHGAPDDRAGLRRRRRDRARPVRARGPGAVHRHGARRRPAAQRHRRRRARSTRPRPVRIVDGILTALEYSHRAGVVHRDIKPGNVMVTTSGQVKVMDFGIARAISDSSATIAQTSAILGTAQYFSPEQARGEAVDARTDLYSTGVVLYELLTGRPPFRGETAVAVAYQHVSEAPVAPSAVNPHVSPALERRRDARAREGPRRALPDGRRLPRRPRDRRWPARCPTARRSPTTSTRRCSASNPNSADASEATLRRLADDTDDRVPRTQTRPPVAWIWGIIALVVGRPGRGRVLGLQARPAAASSAANVAVEIPDIVGESYEDGGNQLLDAAARRRSRSTCRATRRARAPSSPSTPRPAPAWPRTKRCGSRCRPVRRSVALVGLTFKTEQQAQGHHRRARSSSTGRRRVTYSPNVPKGTVIGIELPPDTALVTAAQQVVKGSTVNLVVSNGLVQVPDLERAGGHAGAGDPDRQRRSAHGEARSPDNGCTGPERHRPVARRRAAAEVDGRTDLLHRLTG